MQVSDDQIDAVAPRWHDLVLQSDTNRAKAAFDCVVLIELRCALRNGSAWAPERLSFLQRDAKMIDEKDWKKTALQELQSATDGRRISATAT